mmetsp:Transcript_5882/g.14068  ORF Transcript_5882/g.14068 Transcript_5882/m.14068 type:complete len:105 (-) Transcript_5882:470-784(-)
MPFFRARKLGYKITPVDLESPANREEPAEKENLDMYSEEERDVKKGAAYARLLPCVSRPTGTVDRHRPHSGSAMLPMLPCMKDGARAATAKAPGMMWPMTCLNV